MISAGAAATFSPDYSYAQIYYLPNPPTGSNNLFVQGSSGVHEIYANLVVFTGVNQSSPVRAGTYQNTVNQTLPYTMTITSNVTDLTMSCIIDSTSNINGTNQTEDAIDDGGTYSLGDDHATTAASSISDTWNSGANISMVGLSIEGASLKSIHIQNSKIYNAKFGYYKERKINITVKRMEVLRSVSLRALLFRAKQSFMAL